MSVVFEDRVWQFNHIAGKYDNVTALALQQQAALVLEEAKELVEACSKLNQEGDVRFDNLEPVLDGCVDVAVTNLGIKHMLEKLGANVVGAELATADNNLTKYLRDSDLETVGATILYYADRGINPLTSYNSDWNVYVIRSASTGKILKPVNYSANDLSKFLPTATKETDDE